MGILERANPILKQVKLICTEKGWLLIGKAKNSSGVMEIFCDLIWVAVTWVNIYVKINGFNEREKKSDTYLEVKCLFYV